MIAGTQFQFELAIYFSDPHIGGKLTKFYSHLIANRPNKKLIEFIEKKNSWSVKSAPFSSYFLSECIEAFLEDSFLYKFDYLSNPELQDLQKSIFIKLDLLTGETMPALNLDIKIINFLSTIKCNVDIDMYDLR